MDKISVRAGLGFDNKGVFEAEPDDRVQVVPSLGPRRRFTRQFASAAGVGVGISAGVVVRQSGALAFDQMARVSASMALAGAALASYWPIATAHKGGDALARLVFTNPGPAARRAVQCASAAAAAAFAVLPVVRDLGDKDEVAVLAGQLANFVSTWLLMETANVVIPATIDKLTPRAKLVDSKTGEYVDLQTYWHDKGGKYIALATFAVTLALQIALWAKLNPTLQGELVEQFGGLQGAPFTSGQSSARDDLIFSSALAITVPVSEAIRALAGKVFEAIGQKAVGVGEVDEEAAEGSPSCWESIRKLFDHCLGGNEAAAQLAAQQVAAPGGDAQKAIAAFKTAGYQQFIQLAIAMTVKHPEITPYLQAGLPLVDLLTRAMEARNAVRVGAPGAARLQRDDKSGSAAQAVVDDELSRSGKGNLRERESSRQGQVDGEEPQDKVLQLVTFHASPAVFIKDAQPDAQ